MKMVKICKSFDVVSYILFKLYSFKMLILWTLVFCFSTGRGFNKNNKI